MTSFLRNSTRFWRQSQFITRNSINSVGRQSLQRVRFCSTDDRSNAEVITQLNQIQKQLNSVHKASKKSKWRYAFAALYFTPALLVYGLLWNFWKNAKREIMEQANAYKVI